MFKVTANGVIHRDGCHHADAVKYLWGDAPDLDTALRWAADDFSKVKIAPCAKPGKLTPADADALRNFPDM